MRVGVAGLGRMGSAIAARLMEVGHELTVWNRSSDKATALAAAGAKVAATPAELAGQVDAIVTILTNRDAIASVYEGASGLLSGNVKGKLFIEMSTVQPEAEVALAEKVRAKGGVFVECPVGGTVGPARDGKLLGVAGGTAEDFAVAKPLLAQMCRRVEHVGPVGAGSSMKLALNLPLMVYYQALGESYVLCRHLGLDPKWLMEFLTDTSGAPNILKVRGAKIAAVLGGGDEGPPPSTSTRSARTSPPWWPRARRVARACRWRKKRSPSTMRRQRMAGASATAPRCRPTGRCGPHVGRNADMKLYTYWRSLATFRVRIALNLKGLTVEPIYVDLDSGSSARPSSRPSIRRW